MGTIQTKKYLLEFSKFTLLLLCFLFLVTSLVFYKVIFFANASVTSSPWTLYGVIISIFLLSRIPYAYLYEDKHKHGYSDLAYPSVSVVISAKNEEAGIFRTIEKCIKSDYPSEIECIVIDDGSTDGTKSEIMRAVDVFKDRVKMIAFSENQGKREGMAAGVNEARHEIIIFVDSDSFLEPDAIRNITEHFIDDPTIGAVSGNTKVENVRQNLLTRMQSIQYAISFDIYKTCESVHKSVTCCPGCFSAYRKVAIKPLIHKWKEQRFLGIKGTFGDDRGLTNFVLKSWNIIYCERARATTNVPFRFPVYWKQQLRWKKSWIREGIFAGAFMWKRHPFASLGFYIHFTFPFLGPILAGKVLYSSIVSENPMLFLIFITGFMLIGMVFALFVRVYRGAENWMFMPLFSAMFISTMIWQMPYAFLTLRDSRWGTR